MSLTKKGMKLLESDADLFEYLFLFYVNRYVWSSDDYWGMDEVGQFGAAFSLVLVDKYGSKKKRADFMRKIHECFPYSDRRIRRADDRTLAGLFAYSYCLRAIHHFSVIGD